MKVAFIGIGNMGKPMASNIAKRGHEVFLFDANPAAAARVAKETGATVLGSLSEISVAEVIVTMLPDGKVVREVALGEHGIAAVGQTRHDRRRYEFEPAVDHPRHGSGPCSEEDHAHRCARVRRSRESRVRDTDDHDRRR